MNKQIEEMANIIYDESPSHEMWSSDSTFIAEAIYNAGYRKTSEVAREIIQEVRNAWANSWTESEFLEMLKDIEKKYEVTEE